MLNLKQKAKSYNFWVSLSSASLLLSRFLGQQFGIEIDSNAFMDIITAICGILVFLGIITMPTVVVESSIIAGKGKRTKTQPEPEKSPNKKEKDMTIILPTQTNNEGLLNNENAQISGQIIKDETSPNSFETACDLETDEDLFIQSDLSEFIPDLQPEPTTLAEETSSPAEGDLCSNPIEPHSQPIPSTDEVSNLEEDSGLVEKSFNPIEGVTIPVSVDPQPIPSTDEVSNPMANEPQPQSIPPTDEVSNQVKGDSNLAEESSIPMEESSNPVSVDPQPIPSTDEVSNLEEDSNLVEKSFNPTEEVSNPTQAEPESQSISPTAGISYPNTIDPEPKPQTEEGSISIPVELETPQPSAPIEPNLNPLT